MGREEAPISPLGRERSDSSRVGDNYVHCAWGRSFFELNVPDRRSDVVHATSSLSGAPTLAKICPSP